MPVRACHPCEVGNGFREQAEPFLVSADGCGSPFDFRYVPKKARKTRRFTGVASYREFAIKAFAPIPDGLYLDPPIKDPAVAGG